MDVEKVIRIFKKRLNDNTQLRRMYSGAKNYDDALQFAAKTASMLFVTIDEFANVTELEYETAVDLLIPMLEMNHGEVIRVCEKVQQLINDKAKIGVGVLSPEFDKEKAKGLVEGIVDVVEVTADYVKGLITNNSLSVVDETIRMNAEAEANIGLKVKITRKYDDVGLHNGKDVCQWCLDREGTWDNYQDAYDAGAFQRHAGCHCTITYEVGKTRTRQTRAGSWAQM